MPSRSIKMIKYARVSLAIAILATSIVINITHRSPYRVDNSAPVWSPDGSSIIFTAHTYTRNSIFRNSFLDWDTDGDSEIYQANVDGSGVKQLTDDPKRNVRDLQWSPTGKSILFGAVKHDDFPDAISLYTIKLNGSKPEKVRDMFDSYPRWSPDGLEYSFMPIPASADAELIDSNGKKLPDLSNGVLSPDRQKLIAIGKQGLVVINIDGTNPVRLTDYFKDTILSWSPDSQRVLVKKYRADYLTTIDINRSDRQINFPIDKTHAPPSWSPDGRQILAERFDENSGSIGLWVTNADGSSQPRKLAIGWGGVWSHNGQKIAFICVARHPRSICTIDSDGSNLKSLDRTTQSVAWSPDSRKIAFTDLVSEPHSLAIVNADGSGFKRLTHQK